MSAMSSRRAPPVQANRRGMLPELLKQIGPDQDIATVTAELPADAPSPIGLEPVAPRWATSSTAGDACDTRACHDAVAARDAAAFSLPPRGGRGEAVRERVPRSPGPDPMAGQGTARIAARVRGRRTVSISKPVSAAAARAARPRTAEPPNRRTAEPPKPTPSVPEMANAEFTLTPVFSLPGGLHCRAVAPSPRTESRTAPFRATFRGKKAAPRHSGDAGIGKSGGNGAAFGQGKTTPRGPFGKTPESC